MKKEKFHLKKNEDFVLEEKATFNYTGFKL